MSVNPYAPPSHDSAGAPTSGAGHGGGAGSFQLAPDDWRVVFSLTRWMRAVFALQIAAALLVAIALALIFSVDAWSSPALAQLGKLLPLLVGLLLVMIAFLVVGSIFLRRSAKQIHQGTVDGAPRLLASGFRSLRVYLVIYALYEVTTLASNIYRAVVGS